MADQYTTSESGSGSGSAGRGTATTNNFIKTSFQVDESSQQLLFGAFEQYEKIKWLKVTFNGQTKRIYDPPRDLELLLSQLKKRFPVLRLLLQNTERPQQAVLGYRNDDRQLQVIKTSFAFIEALRYVNKAENKVFHITVTTKDADGVALKNSDAAPRLQAAQPE